MNHPGAKKPDFASAQRAPRSARKLWTSLEELAGDPDFEKWLKAEFPAIAESITPTRRRQFLKLMGASFLMANLAGCLEDTSGTAVPYVRQPEGAHPDKPQHFASAVPLSGYAQPVLATVYDGRPTKLDGNPEHPATRGKSDPFLQAAVLGLYDPDRSQAPLYNGELSTWNAFGSGLQKWRKDWVASKGEGLRIVMGQTTSPTLVRLAKQFLDQFPAAKIHIFEPLESTHDWTKAVFGRPLDVHFHLDQCDTVVSLDHDLLGPGPHQLVHAIGWGSRRGDAEKRIRLHIAEPSPTVTGSVASSRFIASTARLGTLTQAISASLGVGETAPELTAEEKNWTVVVSAELQKDAGRSLLCAGPSQPAWVHALVAKINERLGNTGKAVWYGTPVAFSDPRLGNLADLTADVKAGKVRDLICLDSNPVYAADADFDFTNTLRLIENRVHIGLYRDETAKECLWHLPLSHPLESWGDLRAVDGRATIVQPLIQTLYDSRTLPQFFALILNSAIGGAEETVRATWQDQFSGDFGSSWRKALRDGWVERAPEPASIKANDIPSSETASKGNSIEVIFRPDPTIWDGRFANNGWLQELPKPLLTTTWDNVLAVSPQLARELSLENGDHLELTLGEHKLTAPGWILPGQAARSVTAYFGYGRTSAGSLATGRGYNAFSIRPSNARWRADASLRKVSGKTELAVTQTHHRMEGFDFVREVTDEAPALKQPEAPATLYPQYARAEHAWAMAIDIDRCISCNACVAACTAENNVPVVGKEEVIRGREMHWIRIARYYEGSAEQPRSHFQPLPCMHCEAAPCEMGCPVHATVHSPEGLNQMVYNRCIGTRTCSSFCPYKVRRFNWFDYRAPAESPLHAAHNPDVTVRSRGVMEKCTYCTQRIEAAETQAHIENRSLRRDEVVTACQAACPTQAIVFGDLNDSDSAVSKRRESSRHYTLLEELGTKPRTTYLARWLDSFPAKGEKS
jgi:molybdopterin-containing oxidoreductase family iron-sulfur binding subunit